MWNYFLIMLWLLYMLSAGIHLFSRGFLLSRMTLENVNDCVHMNLCDDIDNVSIEEVHLSESSNPKIFFFCRPLACTRIVLRICSITT